MKHRSSLSLAALLLGGVSLWGAGVGQPAGKTQILVTPAPGGSTAPRVTAGSGGSVLMSWIEQSKKGSAFRFSVWKAGLWSDARTIAEGPEVLAVASSEPGVLELPDHVLAAQWLIEAKEKEANHIVVAVSRDGGRTWSKPVIPYRNSTPGEHMYVSLFPWRGGGAGVVWLDPRGGKKTSLMQATIDEAGNLGPERVISGDVCSCCPTSSAITDEGPVVLYRGHTDAEIRDMHVAQLHTDVWQPGAAAHADNWKINGCPTNSGSIAARGTDVAAAWFTAAAGRKRVEIAFSRDSGKTFGEPMTLDAKAPAGKASLALLADGSVAAAWIASGANGTALCVRSVKRDLGMNATATVESLAAGSRFGFPFVAAAGKQAMVVWAEQHAEKPAGVKAALYTAAE